MNYYQQPFVPFQPGVAVPYQQGQDIQQLDVFDQQSYIENILRDNYGKLATVYMNFEGSQWGSKVFKGILQAAGTDHIILKDVSSETRYLLLTIYLCYVTFDEKIEYEYPYRNK